MVAVFGGIHLDGLMDVKVLLGLLESMNIGVIFVDADGIVRYCNAAAQVNKQIPTDMILNRSVYDCHPLKTRDKVSEMLANMKEKKINNWKRLDIHDEPNLENMVSPVFTPDGEFIGIIMIILDVTSHKELTDRLRKSERKLAALYKSSQTLSSSLNLNDVLFKILLLAGEVINFSSGTIYLVDEEKLQIVPMSTIDCLLGEDQNSGVIGCNAPDNIIAFAVRSGEMVSLERGKPGFNQVCKRPNSEAALILPLNKDREKCLGVLVVESEDPDIFRLEEQELLNTFANHAGLAIRNAQLYARAQQMAISDGLTGLYNRQYFDQILNQAMAQAKRKNSYLTVIMIDVNDLKFINDYFGHVMGDYVIKAAATELQRSVREADTVCRYGGDELVILLPDTSDEEVVIIHKRILENVARWNEEENKYPDVRLSLSVGCATAHGLDGLSDILARADQNMYEDKRRYKMGIHEGSPVERAKKQYYSF